MAELSTSRKAAIREVWPQYMITCCMYGKQIVLKLMRETKKDPVTDELIRRIEKVDLK
jgi:hypothetical protein